MFDIKLLNESEKGPNGERLGQITIGDHTERFACYPTVDASVNSFPNIWRQRLEHLIDGESSVKLDYDPRFSWVIYREGESCFVQQIFFPNGINANIPERKTISENGDPISEWNVSLDSISSYL